MRILLADDDPQILRALRITLTARGYDVTTHPTVVPPSTPPRRCTPISWCSTWECRDSRESK